MDATESARIRQKVRPAVARLVDPLNEAIAVELGPELFARAVAESARDVYAALSQVLDELTT